MKNKFLIRLLAASLVVACVLVTSGCWSSHPHSAYRPIHQYAINGDAVGMATELAKYPEEVNLPEDGGLTPLHLAAENCHTNIVGLLLDKGAKINVTANDKATPLHLAAQEGCLDAVRVLLERAAKINVRDNQNRTPLGRAEQWQQSDVVTFLKQHGAIE